MAAAGTMDSQQNAKLSFGVYKPQEDRHIDDVVAQMVRTATSIDKCGSNSQSDISMTILRSINGNSAAAIAESKGREDANPWLNLAQAASFTKGLSLAVRMVDSGRFELGCEEGKDRFCSRKKKVGEVVSVRRIYSGGKNKEKLAYCCLAILKAYFTNREGLISYSFYNSLDGKSIIGLGTWESADSAYNNVHGCTAEAFWKSLGAKKLKYDFCRVVYVSKKNEEIS